VSKVTPLRKKDHHHDVFIRELLLEHATRTTEEKARAILARMHRTYSHIIIDGTEYILVPSAQSPRNPGPAA
jgi:hypothetical protein